MVFTERSSGPHGTGTGRGAKLAMKKNKSIKSDHIPLDDISRVEFIRHIFRIHDLTDQYSPGINMGPGFKLAWTGSPCAPILCLVKRRSCSFYSGGKSGATTIETDREWDVARLAVMKKNKATCGVTVEIDIDLMEGFRIRKRVSKLSIPSPSPGCHPYTFEQ
jgi:hypothetical protein